MPALSPRRQSSSRPTRRDGPHVDVAHRDVAYTLVLTRDARVGRVRTVPHHSRHAGAHHAVQQLPCGAPRRQSQLYDVSRRPRGAPGEASAGSSRLLGHRLPLRPRRTGPRTVAERVPRLPYDAGRPHARTQLRHVPPRSLDPDGRFIGPRQERGRGAPLMRPCDLHALMLGALMFELSAADHVAAAQGFRVTGTSLASYVELRPAVEDSIPDTLTTGTGLVRGSGVGAVSCPTGQAWCYYYRSLPVNHTVPLTQDLEATGWGLGQGVSVYAHVRLNANGGGATELWTREDDHVEALAIYVELDRDRWTARAGRQWLTSQLGLNNFDGLSLTVRPLTGLSVEGYAGRSLIQGLSQPFTSDNLAAADVLPPDDNAVLLGTVARWRPALPIVIGAE